MEDTQVTTAPAESGATTAEDNSAQSQENLQEQISKALDESEPKAEPEGEGSEPKPPKQEKQKTEDNTEKCPDKFKNEDGSVNVDNLLKSYKEIEHLVSEKTSWEKERAELLKDREALANIQKQNEEKAKSAGYDSAQDMQQVYDLAYAEANEYAKYLQYVEDPEEVRSMLINYANNPSAELMEQIELEFAPEVNKRVAIVSDRLKQSYDAQKAQDANTTKMMNVESVVKQSVEENRELFEYEPFKELFINTLDKYGDNFTIEDSRALMSMVGKMKEVFRAEFEKQHGIKSENNAATDKIASLNSNSSAPAAKQLTNADIDSMSDKELRKEISKYI